MGRIVKHSERNRRSGICVWRQLPHGAAGCGKTTAMHMVAGLEEVTKGAITIDGEDITELPPRKQNISMIFQNYAVWPRISVYDNIAYALKLKKMNKADIDDIVKDVAEMTKMGDYLERFPSQLSGGHSSGLRWHVPLP